MKKILFAITFLFNILYANTIESLVEEALKKNFELKSIERSIQIANENIALATKLSNPVVVFGINDIHTNDITARDKEAMQAQYIGISQTIPITNKLEIKESIEITNKDIIKLTYEDKKLLLKSKIYEFFYKIAILEEKKDLLLKQRLNLKKLNELEQKVYKTSKLNANKIYNTKIDKQKLDIKINQLNTEIKILKLKLEEITYTKNSNFNIDIKPYKINTTIDDKHPKIEILILQQKAFKQKENFFEASKTSDIKLSASYFNRDDKYQDYVNISVAIPLSIYNRENLEANKARHSYIKVQDDLKTLKINFKTNQLILQNRANLNVKNYEIIKNRVIKLQENFTQNLNLLNRFQNNSLEIIKNLNKTLEYELLAINEKDQFLQTVAKLKYYEGKK